MAELYQLDLQDSSRPFTRPFLSAAQRLPGQCWFYWNFDLDESTEYVFGCVDICTFKLTCNSACKLRVRSSLCHPHSFQIPTSQDWI
jgi:hypothetical protein